MVEIIVVTMVLVTVFAAMMKLQEYLVDMVVSSEFV